MVFSSAPLAVLASLAGVAFDSSRTAIAGCPYDVSNTYNRQAGEQWDESVEGALGTHKFSLPNSYDISTETPLPLLLYFHGWGGGTNACGSFCNEASDRGFATISMQGIAGPGEKQSFNGFGSTNSFTGTAVYPDPIDSDWDACEDEKDRICNIDPYGDFCYSDCDGQCADDCWWTTCKDSVGQALAVLEHFTQQFCIDEKRIFATGCSNGGMFLFELASDERMATKLAAVAPMVGLPHYGFNVGPTDGTSNFAVSFFGSWGLRDPTVPPIENESAQGCLLPCRTSEDNGWFYTSSNCTTRKWAEVLGIDTNYNPDIGDLGQMKNERCWSYSSTDSTVEVIGCHFSGNHMTGCNQGHQISPMLDFFEAHPQGGSQPSSQPSTSSQPSSQPSSHPISQQSCQPSSQPSSWLWVVPLVLATIVK